MKWKTKSGEPFGPPDCVLSVLLIGLADDQVTIELRQFDRRQLQFLIVHFGQNHAVLVVKFR